jgi:uncharacterized protein (TIGR01568 family)
MSKASRTRQFPVGQRRDVPVADAGCGCRPRRLRLLSLPWFLRSSGRGEQRNSPWATSTASFSSSSCAGATRSSSTGGYSSSAAYSSDHYDPPLATRRQQETRPASKKKRTNKAARGEDGGGVGVAVEKDSYDPRADFRDSMAQMVAEMGLCDWDGLRCMLRRLLALNAPRHHAAILAAFAEVCAQIVAAPPSPAAYRR